LDWVMGVVVKVSVWVFNVLASHCPRTNPLLYSQEVWFTKLVALTVISYIIDR